MTSLKRIIVLVGVGLGLWLTAGSAEAQTYVGYPCVTRYEPAAGQNTGSDGDVYFTLYTAPACGGTLVANQTLCSAGATNTNCNAAFRNPLAALMAIYAQLAESGRTQHKVQVYTSACVGGGASCPRFVSILAN